MVTPPPPELRIGFGLWIKCACFYSNSMLQPPSSLASSWTLTHLILERPCMNNYHAHKYLIRISMQFRFNVRKLHCHPVCHLINYLSMEVALKMDYNSLSSTNKVVFSTWVVIRCRVSWNTIIIVFWKFCVVCNNPPRN